MTINEKALFDFMYCPLYFHTKYALHVPLDNTNKWHKCIHDTVKFFFTALLNGEVKTYKQLQRKWDAFAEHFQLDKKQLVNGWEKVVRIIEWSKTNKIMVGDVNCDYYFSSNKHTIKGQIAYILVTPSKEIELLYFDLSDKKLNELETHKQTKHLLDYYGFEALFNQKPTRLKIFQPHTNTSIVLSILENDKKRLTSIIENTGECIQRALYVPREGYMCATCQAKSYCRHFCNKE